MTILTINPEEAVPPKESILFYLKAAYARLYDAEQVPLEGISWEAVSAISAAVTIVNQAIDIVKEAEIE